VPYPWPFTDERDADMEPGLWDRVHPSWKALEVARSAESREEARARLLPRFDVPSEVLEQWICAHYFNHETLSNYAWIDFDRARFEMEQWSTSTILQLRVIGAYQSFVEDRSTADWSLAESKPFFAPGSGGLEAWRDGGTWRVPPVAIDPAGFGSPPAKADLSAAPQLVEGHSRFGHLRRFFRLGAASGVAVADEHALYVLRAR